MLKASMGGILVPVFLIAQGTQPQISPSGIVGAGLSSPAVLAVSSGGIVSIFGTNFGPAGLTADAGKADLVNGALPTKLGGVCVQFNGIAAPILAVRSNLVNAQVPLLGSVTSASVIVVAGCGTASQSTSSPVTVAVRTATPEFFPFAHIGGGPNPVAAINLTKGSYVGPVGLIAGVNMGPAMPGDIVSIFATGMGPLQTPLAPGVLAVGADPLATKPTISIGGISVDPASILYAGAAPGDAGVYQINLTIPAGVPQGNQPVNIDVGDIPGPAGYLAVGASASTGGTCALPGINGFTATPVQLTSAGPVTLYWSVSGSDTVNVSGVGDNLAASGSTQLQASSGNTYTLTATTSCGSSTATASVGVGAARIVSVSNASRLGAGAAGQPGDLIAIQVGNIGDPSDIDFVSFQQPAGAYAAALPESISGNTLYVRVPFVNDSAQSSGYDSGLFSVAVTNSAMTSSGAAFNIQPLMYAGDPVADLQALVASLTGTVRQALGSISSDPNYGKSASGLLTFLAPYASDLTQFAADLKTKGSATLTIDRPSTLYPNPQTSTVTASDVANWLAFRQNLSAAAPSTTAAALSVTAKQPQAVTAPCIQLAQPLLPVCQAISAITGPIDAFTDQLGRLIAPDLLEIAASGAKSLELPKILTIADKINTYVTYAKALCLVSPVYLKNFYFIPSTIQVAPHQQTELDVNLVALSAPSPSAIVKFLLDKAYEKVYEKTKGSKKWGPAEVRVGLASLVQLVTQSVSEKLGSVLAFLPQAAATSGGRVGTCDVAAVRSLTNRFVQVDPASEQGNPYYYFNGVRPGTEQIGITPVDRHFLISRDLFARRNPACKFLADGTPDCYAPLTALGKQQTQISMLKYSLESDLNLVPIEETSSDSQQPIDFTQSVAESETADGTAQSKLTVRQMTDDTWRIDIAEFDHGYTAGTEYDFTSSSVGGTLQFTTPSTGTNGALHIRVTINAQGDCWTNTVSSNGLLNGNGVFQLQYSRPDFAVGNIVQSAGPMPNSSSFDYYLPALNDPFPPYTARGTFFFALSERFGAAATAGGPAYTQACSATITLQLLNN